jgi:hypothetical protein
MKPQRTLAEIAGEIRKRTESVADIIAIGGLLREAKKQLQKDGGRSWLGWLAKEVDFSVRTAENYMSVHGLANTFATVANLTETLLTPGALYWVASNKELECRQIEKILRKGKKERITRADLEHAAYLKERDEEAAMGDSKEIENILDGPAPELPSPPPEPMSQPLPPSDADDLLDEVKVAINTLKRASTKHAERFRKIPVEDIRAAAAFLNYLVDAFTTKAAA